MPRMTHSRLALGRAFSGHAAPLLLGLLCIFAFASSLVVSVSAGSADVDLAWDAASAVALEEPSWMPSGEIDTGGLSTLGHSMTQLYSMTDRELFDLQSTLTGHETCLPDSPPCLVASNVSITLVTLTWQTPSNDCDGDLLYYTVTTQLTDEDAVNKTVSVNIVPATDSPTFTVTGLTSNVSYIFLVTSSSSDGVSNSTSYVYATTHVPTPTITSYVATSTSSNSTTYSNAVTLTIGFDLNTNHPAVDTTSDLTTLFSFKPSIGASFSGEWTDAKTLVIDIIDAGSASPTIGLATVTGIGSLYAEYGTSLPVRSTSPPLSGTFGSSGLLGEVFTVTPPSTATHLGVGLNESLLDSSTSYLLVVSVITPLLPGSYLTGTGYSTTSGLVLSAVDTPANLVTDLSSLVYTVATGYTGYVSINFHLLDTTSGDSLSTRVLTLSVTSSSDSTNSTDTDTTNSTSSSSSLQANGLAIGVVRVSMLLTPGPILYNVASFKAQLLADIASVLGLSSSRMAVRALSATSDGTTVVFDFLSPNDTSVTTSSTSPAPEFLSVATRKLLASGTVLTSQQLYNLLVSLDALDFQDTTYLSLVEPATISQLCEDSVYRHDCSSTDTSSAWSTWILPLLIALCALVAVCLVGAIVFAAIKCRRRPEPLNGGLKLAPPTMINGQLVPAKKFVYTAPTAEAAGLTPEESMSEVTLRPVGQEFEPSHHSISGGVMPSIGSDDTPSKNRLPSRFPNKAGGGVGAAAAVEESRSSSHHFYYVDDSRSGGSRLSRSGSLSSSGLDGSSGSSSNTPATGVRRLARHDSSAHFTVESSQARSEMSVSRSAASTSQSHSGSTSNPSSGSAPNSVPSSPASSGSSSRRGSIDELVLAGGSRKNSIGGGFDKEKDHALDATEYEKEKVPLPVLRPAARTTQPK